MEFGEYSDREDGQSDEDYDSQRDSEDSDGHNDAKLRIWLKFEGISDEGVMKFYLVLSGGNRDAPYFREKYSTTVFESDFEAKSLAGFKKKAKSEIAKLIKAMPLK